MKIGPENCVYSCLIICWMYPERCAQSLQINFETFLKDSAVFDVSEEVGLLWLSTSCLFRVFNANEIWLLPWLFFAVRVVDDLLEAILVFRIRRFHHHESRGGALRFDGRRPRHMTQSLVDTALELGSVKSREKKASYIWSMQIRSSQTFACHT